ncbi:hypothetical protein LJC52_04680 [Bacteroidales bacterium OttesenSCG-928-A17]|nr:hypothetical protein [Bacteroidales bacterium OttesenSCG-928-A17]
MGRIMNIVDKHIETKQGDWMVLAALLIVFTEFYKFQPLMDFFRVLQFFITVVLFIYCFNTVKTHRSIFSFPILLIILSVLFSIFPANFGWGQSFVASLKVIPKYLAYILFFFLVNSNYSIKRVEKIMLFFSALYVILYLFQLANHKTLIFGDWTSTGVVRGIVRIIFAGEGFMFFALAYYFNKVMLGERKYYNLFILGIFTLIMFMQVTRQYILAFAIMVMLGLLRKTKIYVKILAFILVIVAFNIYQYSSHPMIAGIRDAQVEDVELKDEYIRVIAGKYFLTEMAPNKFTAVFGNGVPGNSSYGSFCNDLALDDKFYFVDLGLIGAYAMFGIFYVLGYLLIAFKTIKYDPGREGEYLRYYLLMIFIMSLTSGSVLSSGYMASLAVVLYLYEKYYTQKQEEEEEEGEEEAANYEIC